MYVIREVLHCKPGKVRQMADKFRSLSATMKDMGHASAATSFLASQTARHSLWLEYADSTWLGARMPRLVSRYPLTPDSSTGVQLPGRGILQAAELTNRLRLLDHRHREMQVVGHGTGLCGDPSGCGAERSSAPQAP